jgi:hypothetical protein
MYLDDPDLYYRLLAARLREMLSHKEAQEAQSSRKVSPLCLVLFVVTN